MSPKMPIRFNPEARQDINDIVSYYTNIRPPLGRQFLHRLVDSLDSIRERPGSFPLMVDDIRRASLTQFQYGIFFFVAEEIIRVIAVVDLRRHESAWRRRR